MEIFVSDIRVNNAPASNTVRIVEPYPSISWTYGLVNRVTTSTPPSMITDVSTAKPSGYDIRLGTNAADIGNDNFFGDLIETGFVSSDSTTWRYYGSRLNRGHTYYGQIRITDSLGNTSEWASFSFRYNSLPSASNLTISPASPSVNDNLILSYTFTDPDGDLEGSSKIWWYRNGVHDSQLDGKSVIDSKHLSYNDVWQAKVYPGDGFENGASALSNTVTVTTDVPVASNAYITPTNPTYDDPLYAKYTFTSHQNNKDRSVFKWYVNGSVIPDATTAFVRLSLSEGDSVFFEVQPSDGTLTGSWLASSTVVIGKPKFRITNLRVDHNAEPLSLSSLTPTISWTHIGPGEPSSVSLLIGTAPASDNVYSVTLSQSTDIFTVPSDVLSEGSDYYVSVAASDGTGFGEYTTAHFRTSGSRWSDSVSNAIGWTVETSVQLVPTGVSSSSSNSSSSALTPDGDNYQGVKIFDGTKYVEIKLYADKVVIVGTNPLVAAADLTEYSVITITGKTSDVKVYKDYELLIDGSGQLVSTTSNAYIEFGATGPAGVTANYHNFYYTTAGAFEPSNSTQYFNLKFNTFYEFDGNIDYVTGVNGTTYFSASDEDAKDSSTIYQVSDNAPQQLLPVARNQLSINRIVSHGGYTYVCHERGATVFTNYLIPNYSINLDFTNQDDPTAAGFNGVDNVGGHSYSTDGLVIDTIPSGKLYFGQNHKGTSWFDGVDNDRGWTVDFSVKVQQIADDGQVSNTDQTDGIGIYVNDGKYYETVQFFENAIVFATTGISVEYDTTSMSQYLLVGKRGSIKLYVKQSDAYSLLATSQLTEYATTEGNAGRPSIAEDASGNLHAVWHDDGAEFRQIYYAFGKSTSGSIEWGRPKKIVSQPFGAANPSIAIDSGGTLYVVFESERNDSTDIGIVVKTRFGWSEPYTLSSGIYESKSPKVAVGDDDSVHVVWEDKREVVGQIYHMSRAHSTGKWTAASSVTSSPYGSRNPALFVYKNQPYVSFSQSTAEGFSDVYVITDNGNWTAPIAFSVGGIDADYSDIVVDNDEITVVWHDNQNSEYEIYARRATTAFAFLTSVDRITNESVSCRFPTIGVRHGNDASRGFIYTAWETGGELLPYDPSGFAPTSTYIDLALYSKAVGSWLSSNISRTIGVNVYGGYDVRMIPGDLRVSRRPAIAKTFAGNAHILYETELATADDEYIVNADSFVTVRDINYDLTYASTYSLSDASRDLQVSGKQLRKEIRFGDFSDARSVNCTFGHFRAYTEDAVEPFKAAIIDEGKPVTTASLGDEGDGWLATNVGLDFYFRPQNLLSRFSDAYGMLSTNAIQDVAFDHNNIMYVASDGIYISHDHRNFYSAFSFLPSDVRSIAFDSHNNMWVATGAGVWKVQTLDATSTLSRDGTNVIPSHSSSSSVSSSSSSSSGGEQPTGNEIKIVYNPNASLYCFIINPAGKIWDGTTFQSINSANWSSYAIALTEQPIASLYYASFPTSITVSATYTILVYEKSGTSPLSTDSPVGQGEVQWDGQKEVQPGDSSSTASGGGTSTPGDVNGDGITDDNFQCLSGDTGLGYSIFDVACGMPSNNCTRVYVDEHDQVWVTTDAGLIQIRSNFVSVFNSRNSGLASDFVNDIAIKGNGVRYIATANGIAKMTGTRIKNINVTDASWSDNITAIAWKDPNILWAGGASKLFQLTFDEIDDSVFTVTTFEAQDFANYAASDCVDLTKYTFNSIDTNSLVQVLVNGRVVNNGYRVFGGQLAFDAPLRSTDTVEVIVRKDISEYATLDQNQAEVLKNGVEYRQLKKFVLSGTNLYGATQGDKNQLVVYNAADIFNMPYDKIVLDTTAPTGNLVYDSQVSRRLVNMHIDDAVDNISGLKNMIISNYPNFTSDGSTPLPWVPFKQKFTHDLGTDFGNVFTELSLTGTTGSRLVSYNGTFFAGGSQPAKIFRYNTSTTVWTEVSTLDPSVTDTSIEFMTVYKNSIVIGTGSESSGGKLWISGDGTNYSLVAAITGTHAKSAATLSDVLYIGTGPNGKIYSFDGSRVQDVFTGLGSTIYSLAASGKFLYVGTGEQARVYKFDPTTEVAQILYVDSDSRVTALGSTSIQSTTPSTTAPPDDLYVFAGMGSKGRLVKSINGQPFTVSFSTVPCEVAQIKSDTNGVIHACVGKTIYRYQGKSWQARYTNPENIEDVAFDQNGMAVISANAIRRVNNDIANKKIYLALQDAAGNSSVTTASMSTEISISDLVNFTNTNRLIELDEYGDEVFTYDGTQPFYSGNKIIQEQGIYFSEVFNGTNDHVAWDIIYWDAYVPDGTDLEVFVRTGNSRTQILTNTFDKSFGKDDFEGGDISTLSGQYIQFKVVMTTTVRGKSPKLYRVNLRSRARSSVHFFTTNFALPSIMKGGLLTAETFVPVAGDIIFGINTNDSVDFADYQIIEPDRIFSMDPEQIGTNLRIGVKLISPLSFTVATDAINEYSPYSNFVYNNVVDFEFTAPSDGSYNFKAELYDDPEFTSLATTLYSGSTPVAFSVNNAAFPDNGTTLSAGQIARVLIGAKGNAAIRCNEYYYLKLYSSVNSSFTLLSDDAAFLATCNPTFADVVSFDYTNNGTSGNFHFRVKVYSDVTRTQLVKTFYSGTDQSGWVVDNAIISSGGAAITHGQTVIVDFTPSLDAAEATTYYLVVDVFDGTNFTTLSNSFYIRISPSPTFVCGEYADVPVVKNIAIMFEIEEYEESFGSRTRIRRTIPLNI